MTILPPIQFMTTRENVLNMVKHGLLSLLSIAAMAAGKAALSAVVHTLAGPDTLVYLQAHVPAASALLLIPVAHSLQVSLLNWVTKMDPGYSGQ